MIEIIECLWTALSIPHYHSESSLHFSNRRSPKITDWTTDSTLWCFGLRHFSKCALSAPRTIWTDVPLKFEWWPASSRTTKGVEVKGAGGQKAGIWVEVNEEQKEEGYTEVGMGKQV